jgi:uncharacterized integral membrane protein
MVVKLMKTVRLIINLVIFLFLLVLAIDNMKNVELSFFGLYTIDVPLVIALVAFVFIGFIVGIMFNFANNFRLKSQISRLTKELSLAKTPAKETLDIPNNPIR